jgi:hypothetical protein
MPGLNAVINFKQDTQKNGISLDKILETMNLDQNYSYSTIFENKNVKVIFSGYVGYPQNKFDLGDKSLIIEGAIYNKSMEQVKNELAKILPSIADGSGKTGPLIQFMFDTDGEYVIYYIDNATSTAVIFNDAMGRLPSYYYYDDKQFILGRALKFLTGNLSTVQPNEFALIEYFLFSAPLGDRTSFKNIFRMMPCTLFVINYKSGKCDKQTPYRYNFDDRWDDRPPEQYVKELHDRFLEGVSNRVNRFKDEKHLLALSGGLDSRAILMALRKCKANFETFTYNDHFNSLGRDLPVVETLVKMYGLNNKLFKLNRESIPYMERMISLKDGCTPMGTMGSILNLMELVEKEYGRKCVYYVGDEGNYTTAPRYGGGEIGSTPELVKKIMAVNSLSAYSIEEAAKLFGKTSKEVMNYLCDYFSSYPEKDNIHKVDHYFIWERSFKFTMENQERVRIFFWPLSPHYNAKYAPYAFKIKNKYLAGWKIYAGLLKSLDERSASIKYANFGIALDSPLMPYYLPLRSLATSNETIRHNLLMVLRLLKNPTSIGRKSDEFGFIGELRKYLNNLVAQNESLKSILNTDYLSEILANDRYIFRMYIATNIVKYLTLVENKEIKTPIQV